MEQVTAKIKQKAERIAIGVHEHRPLLTEEEYVKLSDVLGVLGELQKTHVAVERKKLLEILAEKKPLIGRVLRNTFIEQLLGDKPFNQSSFCVIDKKQLREMDLFVWFRDNQEVMIKRFSSEALYPHEVLRFFIDKEILGVKAEGELGLK